MTRVRTGPLRCASIALGVVALMAFAAPSAHAGKGWAFEETFGSANEPAFGNDGSMAVDLSGENAGDLLVIDVSNQTLSRWNPDGTPSNFAALGTNVIDGAGPGPDETPSGEIIGFFTDPREVQVSVDNSVTATAGNIYVTNNSGGVIDIFSSGGDHLGQLSEYKQGDEAEGSLTGFGEPCGVAVDNGGAVFVGDFNKSEVHKYVPSANPPLNGDSVANFGVPSSPCTVAAGSGPTDSYIFVNAYGGAGTFKVDSESGEIDYLFGASPITAVVEPTTGHVFVARNTGVVEYDASGPTEATQVSSLADAGSALQGLAVEAGGETLYLSRASHPFVDVWEAVPTPTATVDPPSPVSGAKATAVGTVDPEAAAVTECFFEYGKTTTYGQQAPCTEYEEGGIWKPLASPAELGTGSEPVAVRGELTGMLAQGATYHYRLVAKSPVGQAKSEDEAFKTAHTFFTDPASGITDTAATLNGTVKLEGVPLTGCQFEWGKTTEYGQSVPCSPPFGSIPNDDADHAVTGAISGLEPSTVYHFRLVAQNALGQIVAEDRTFATQGLPGIDSQTASALGETTATLQALVNPFGTTTSYHFEWGPDETYGNRIPAAGEREAGSGSEPVLVNTELSGLNPSSEYHFRVVASNPFGTTTGPDHRFETLNEHGLPDNRGFELVSPVDKGASGSVAGGLTAQLSFQPAEDGGSFIWPLQNGIPNSTSGGWTRWRAERDAENEGWLSVQLSTPSLIAPPRIDGIGAANPSLVRYASGDLRCGLVQTYNPITADTPIRSVELGVENLYLWRVDGEDVSYELITDRVPLNPAANPPDAPTGLFTQIEAAEDCSRVYFRSVYELIAGGSGLYEWDEGVLRDAGVLPNGSVGLPLGTAGRAVSGGEVDTRGTARWNAVSPDGSRLFFTAIANEGPNSGKPAIFMREDGGASVVEISASENPAVPLTNGARFEAASPDGSRVLFRANYGIAGTSSPGPTNEACGPQSGETTFEANPPLEAKRCDLYLFDVETGALTDLSADANPADAAVGAQVQGAVAVDNDGSHVYFAALGQLVPGEGRTYAQNVAGKGSANVYLVHGGELSYVTTLAREIGSGGSLQNARDLFFGATMRMGPGAWTAETSADGGRLLFDSASRLTWYDNVLAGKPGERGKVAYLYSADTGEIACVSCRPDGQPTLVPPNGGEPRLLAAAPRSMSDDGSRIFFTSPDVLMPGAEAGKRNVYEWEEGQLYFLAIAELGGKGGLLPPLALYLGASASGDSAFLASDQRLAPQDRDFISDVYAVRVDGGFDAEEVPPDCQVDESVPLGPNQIYCQGERAQSPPDVKASLPPADAICPKGKLRRGDRCLTKRQIAKRRCRKVRGKEAKRRCVRKQLGHLNRAANTSRGGAK